MMLRTVNTDVVVIDIATFHDLSIFEFWVAFGIHFNSIHASHLGRITIVVTKLQPCFLFGKKTAWNASVSI
jgi:hypothetical protein